MQTKKIADDTNSLAREAARQRQSAFLPIIDIITNQKVLNPVELIKIGLLAKKGKVPESISCLLTNVGNGPAFNLRYQVVYSDAPKSLVESTFLVGHTMNSIMGSKSEGDNKYESSLALRIENGDGGEHFVRVAYQDVYGH